MRKTRSMIKPKEFEVTPTGLVYIRENIKLNSLTDKMTNETIYEYSYEETCYTNEEYNTIMITKLQNQVNELTKQIQK